ncbi:MAG TPA: sigma-70 family RNA polymerase sigma factor [Nocardioidaceae bacterium]|nr:sigma-70 family RNA polymerase sigma factor [Nocardioidaceae bacterium]
MTELLSDTDTPSDAELISRVRGGDVAAYGELFSRHVQAATRLARQLVRGPDADDLVSDAFAKVLGVLQAGGGPDVAFRAYLLTAVRRLQVDRVRAGSRLQTSDDMSQFDPGIPFQDTAVSGFESGAAARAFASLPERWQLVLWHLEVEGQKPADIAPLLGMSPNSVSALAYRAREGLRQAFLTMHLSDISEDSCRWVNEHLGAYVRHGLAKRDAAKLADHLQECRRCTAMYLELTEVNSDLKAIIAPLLLGAAATGYLASTGSAGTAGAFALLGRVRDVIMANAGVAGAGAAAAGVAAVATTAVLLTQGHPDVVIGADRPIAATTHLAPSAGSSGPSARSTSAGAGTPVSPGGTTPAGALAGTLAETQPGTIASPTGLGSGATPGTTPGGGTAPGTGSATTGTGPGAASNSPGAPATSPAGQKSGSATPTSGGAHTSPGSSSDTGGSSGTPTPSPTHRPTSTPTGGPTTGPTGPETTPPSTGSTTGDPTTSPGTGGDTGGSSGGDTGGGTTLVFDMPTSYSSPDASGTFQVPISLSGLPSDAQNVTFTLSTGSNQIGLGQFTAPTIVSFAEAAPMSIANSAEVGAGADCSLDASHTTLSCSGITGGQIDTSFPVTLEPLSATPVTITVSGDGVPTTSRSTTITPPSADIALGGVAVTNEPSDPGNYVIAGKITGVPAGYSYALPAVSVTGTDTALTTVSSTTCAAPDSAGDCSFTVVVGADPAADGTPVTVTVGSLPGYIDDTTPGPDGLSNNVATVTLEAAVPGQALQMSLSNWAPAQGTNWTVVVSVAGAQPGTLTFTVNDTKAGSSGSDSVSDGSSVGAVTIASITPGGDGDSCPAVAGPTVTCSNADGDFTATFEFKIPVGHEDSATLTVSDGSPTSADARLSPTADQVG